MSGENEQPPRKKRPIIDEEVRMLGYIKRSNKPIFEMLQREAEARGKKPTQLVEEALSHYLTERRLIQSQMTVAELYEALTFLSEVQAIALRNLMDTWKLYFSEERMGLEEVLKTLYPPQQTETIVEKGLILEKRKEIPAEIRMLREKLFTMIEPFLDWAVELLQKSMVDVLSRMLPAGTPLPKLPEAKIPVTLTVEKEEEPVVIKVPEKNKEREKEAEAKSEHE